VRVALTRMKILFRFMLLQPMLRFMVNELLVVVKAAHSNHTTSLTQNIAISVYRSIFCAYQIAG